MGHPHQGPSFPHHTAPPTRSGSLVLGLFHQAGSAQAESPGNSLVPDPLGGPVAGEGQPGLLFELKGSGGPRSALRARQPTRTDSPAGKSPASLQVASEGVATSQIRKTRIRGNVCPCETSL